MDTTRTSLILAVIAVVIAAVAAYLWYDQTQTVDALTEQVAALEREAEMSDDPSLASETGSDSVDTRLWVLEEVEKSLSINTRLAMQEASDAGDLAAENARGIAALEQELNPPPSLGNIGTGSEIAQLRSDLNSLTDCVNLNMDSVYQWSRYPTAGALYGYTCNTRR